MNIICQLLEAKTLSEVKRIEKKYFEILPDNQKWTLMNWVHHTNMRITRVNDEKKKSYCCLIS
jgi:hypothetical protein